MTLKDFFKYKKFIIIVLCFLQFLAIFGAFGVLGGVGRFLAALHFVPLGFLGFVWLFGLCAGLFFSPEFENFNALKTRILRIPRLLERSFGVALILYSALILQALFFESAGILGASFCAALAPLISHFGVFLLALCIAGFGIFLYSNRAPWELLAEFVRNLNAELQGKTPIKREFRAKKQKPKTNKFSIESDIKAAPIESIESAPFAPSAPKFTPQNQNQSEVLGHLDEIDLPNLDNSKPQKTTQNAELLDNLQLDSINANKEPNFSRTLAQTPHSFESQKSKKAHFSSQNTLLQKLTSLVNGALSRLGLSKRRALSMEELLAQSEKMSEEQMRAHRQKQELLAQWQNNSKIKLNFENSDQSPISVDSSSFDEAQNPSMANSDIESILSMPIKSSENSQSEEIPPQPQFIPHNTKEADEIKIIKITKAKEPQSPAYSDFAEESKAIFAQMQAQNISNRSKNTDSTANSADFSAKNELNFLSKSSENNEIRLLKSTKTTEPKAQNSERAVIMPQWLQNKQIRQNAEQAAQSPALSQNSTKNNIIEKLDSILQNKPKKINPTQNTTQNAPQRIKLFENKKTQKPQSTAQNTNLDSIKSSPQSQAQTIIGHSKQSEAQRRISQEIEQNTAPQIQSQTPPHIESAPQNPQSLDSSLRATRFAQNDNLSASRNDNLDSIESAQQIQAQMPKAAQNAANENRFNQDQIQTPKEPQMPSWVQNVLNSQEPQNATNENRFNQNQSQIPQNTPQTPKEPQNIAQNTPQSQAQTIIGHSERSEAQRRISQEIEQNTAPQIQSQMPPHIESAPQNQQSLDSSLRATRFAQNDNLSASRNDNLDSIESAQQIQAQMPKAAQNTANENRFNQNQSQTPKEPQMPSWVQSALNSQMPQSSQSLDSSLRATHFAQNDNISAAHSTQNDKIDSIESAPQIQSQNAPQMPKEPQTPEPQNSFILPPTSFLQKPTANSTSVDETELDRQISDLLTKLKQFRINGDIVRTFSGPVVTTFEFRPAPDVKVSRILQLQDDLAMALRATTIRILAPVPGKDVVGIEIPNSQIETIYLREILESNLFKAAQSPLTMALGKDIMGQPYITDLRKLPHLLIAGTTGSGKSVGINAMILSLLYRNKPQDLKLIMIDPKKLEFSMYEDIPHLLAPIITDAKKAIIALASVCAEMDRRYELMANSKVKTLESYNEKQMREGGEILPFIVIIIDELADLMMTGGKDAEASIARLTQMARACGIHMIVATQRPSVDVVTGIIKANLPSRISYKVGQKIDSKVILDSFGAESLLGRGDMLFTPPGGGLLRLHAPFSSESEIEKITDFLRAQDTPNYDESFFGDQQNSIARADLGEVDDLFNEACRIVREDKKTSISYIQRRLNIGYNRAANILEQLENAGVVSAPNAKGAREILS